MKVIFDIETTGLQVGEDDIIQLGIIDQDGNILFDDYFRGSRKKSWPEAERINHISPTMVADKRTFRQRRREIQKIFNQADELIAYNSSFDMGFLRWDGIKFPDVPISDPMLEFAKIYGEWNEYFQDYKWQKLTKAASFYGYTFDAHDALEDVRATLFVYDKIRNQKK